MGPLKNHQSVTQEQIQRLPRKLAPDGRSPREFAITTADGVKVADVIWMSPVRWDKMQDTGDPSTLAPEICVEVMSETNTTEEMAEKRTLYLAAGAEEVWVVSEDREVRFFDEDWDLDGSNIAEGFPDRL